VHPNDRSAGFLLRRATEELKQAGIDSARLDAEILLADLLRIERFRFIIDPDLTIDPSIVALYFDRIEKRKRRIPVAQIVQKKEFYGREFFVTEDVLVPRPETEILIDTLLALPLPDDAKLLDLCCGSGCIGITALCERPSWSAVFSDLSEKALAVCRKNKESFVPDRNCGFFCGDLYTPLETLRFDAILCNPPYIAPDERSTLMPELSFEPDIALFHEDPERLYRRILTEGVVHLKAPGVLIVELATRWVESVMEAGDPLFRERRIIHDLAGLERFILFSGLR